jgi:hypothetical protein
MIKNLVIVILLVIIALFIFSEPVYKGATINIVHDTVYQQKTFTKYRKGDSIPFVVLDTTYLIDQIHDTIKIISDYSRVYSYSDTIRIDTLGYAYIQDTISQNKIQGRSFKAEINEKTIYVTKTIIPKPKKEVYLGVIGDLRTFDNKVGLGLGLGYKTPKNGLFTINATTNHYSLGYYIKLF